MNKYTLIKKFIIELEQANKIERSQSSDGEEATFLRGEALAYRMILDKMKNEIDNEDERES